MATVNFTYALKRFYPDLNTVEIEASDVNTVVQAIDQTYPGIKDYLLDDQGSLRKHVNIFVDGTLITDRKTLLDQLKPESEVYIMQALSGGYSFISQPILMSKNLLFLGTRKGLIVYKKQGKSWDYHSSHFPGIPVTLAYADENTKAWWACLDHGHWGIKLHKSTDQGNNWEEIQAPKYQEGLEVKEGVPATNKYIWAIANGGKNNPDKLLIGTIPGGLFSSSDYGKNFELNQSLWNHPSRKDHWFGGGFDYPGIHSIVVDPRDNDHFYIGISCAGVFETTDNGKSWIVRNDGLKADFLPDPFAEVGHDPHLLLACPAHPDVLWQQNHCGIYRSVDGGKKWNNISQENGPANFGFTIAVHEKNAEQAWVIPGISDVIRTPIDQSLVVCRTDDGGKSWIEQRNGLPQNTSFDIVYRHGLDITDNTLAFGTTTGNVFISEDLGDHWTCINHFLPMVHSVHFVEG